MVLGRTKKSIGAELIATKLRPFFSSLALLILPSMLTIAGSWHDAR